MNDYMIRAIARSGKEQEAEIRAFAVTTRTLTEYARKAHDTSPVVTAALGRLMSGALMMGDMLKEDDDLLTVRIEGNGPVRGLTVTVDRNGNVKGYPNVSRVTVPVRIDGHLNVGDAVGNGTLTVIRDMGLKDPYVGTIELQSGEIAEDLTYYFAVSEQIPSTIGLGVLVAKDESVLQSGGFCIQLMPFAREETIQLLENNVKNASSVTDMLRSGMTPEQMLSELLAGFEVTVQEQIPVQFTCNCSKERVERALFLIGEDELKKIVADGREEEIKCRFCNSAYHFSPQELQAILADRNVSDESRGQVP